MFYFNDKSVDICLEDGLLTIASQQNDLLATIEHRHLLNVTTENDSLLVHYVVRKKNQTLKLKTLTICGSDGDLQSLRYDIEDKFRIADRPQHLLVIINPKSGKKKGIKIYKKIAAPLLKLCGVKADVIETSKQKEPTEKLEDYNLSEIDGIVTVGGDGLYCECMNGLVSRVQRDNKVDVHKHESNIIPTSLPIGIIPAGSGDVIVQYLHGTRCARTAVLHILLGNHVDSNIASIHEGEKLLSYSALVLGFGLFGGMMYECERFRWMGPARYNIVPLGCMLKRRAVDVEIEYHTSEKERGVKKSRPSGRQIFFPIGFLTTPTLSKNQRTKSTSDLLTDNACDYCRKEEGRIYAVDTHPIMMKEKRGRMVPYFGQEFLNVYTTHTCAFSEHVSQLTKVKNELPDCYDYKFVSKHEVTSYKVKLVNNTVATSGDKTLLQKDYYINCDGEVIRLKEPVFDVKLHRKAVKFFGSVAD